MDRRQWLDILRLLGLGWYVVTAIGIGVAGGLLIDHWADTAPISDPRRTGSGHTGGLLGYVPDGVPPAEEEYRPQGRPLVGLIRRPKFLLALVLVILSLIISHTILRFPFPAIQIKPENLGKELIPLGPLGDFNLTNTILSSWVGLAVIFILAYFATRKLGMVPRGLQNLVEAVLSWLLGLVESIAGAKNGRRFYPLVVTIFIFIIINNWISLVPGFGTVGRMEAAEEVVHHIIEGESRRGRTSPHPHRGGARTRSLPGLGRVREVRGPQRPRRQADLL